MSIVQLITIWENGRVYYLIRTIFTLFKVVLGRFVHRMLIDIDVVVCETCMYIKPAFPCANFIF